MFGLVLGGLIVLAHADPGPCPLLLSSRLRAPVTRAEVLSSGRPGPHRFTRDDVAYEVFVNPGILDAPPNLSIVREYESRGRARRTLVQLGYLREFGWPVVEPFGLVGREVVLGFVEGPTFPAALADPADRGDLVAALDALFTRIAVWASRQKLHVHRHDDELRLRGHVKSRRLHVRLRPEHVVVDLANRRLVLVDLDAG